jgi:hypothetical protein
MRAWVCVLALAGCDRVFGIGDPYEDAPLAGDGQTRPDGAPDDAPTDVGTGTPQLLAYYAFDDNLLDSVSNTPANGSTGVGSVSSGGRHNGYVVFDGTGCVWFTLAAKPAAYTISFWINPTTAMQGDTMLLSRLHMAAALARDWAFTATATASVFHWWTGSIEAADSLGAALTMNQWHHLAITYDGAGMVTYVDGAASPRVLESAVQYGTDSTVYLGCQEASTSVTKFTGDMDELRIYDGALTAAELAALP